jgi:hypothetical protein
VGRQQVGVERASVLQMKETKTERARGGGREREKERTARQRETALQSQRAARSGTNGFASNRQRVTDKQVQQEQPDFNDEGILQEVGYCYSHSLSPAFTTLHHLLCRQHPHRYCVPSPWMVLSFYNALGQRKGGSDAEGNARGPGGARGPKSKLPPEVVQLIVSLVDADKDVKPAAVNAVVRR